MVLAVAVAVGPASLLSPSEPELLRPPYQPNAYLFLGSWTPSQMQHLSFHIILQGSPLTMETMLTTLSIHQSGK